MKPYLKRILAMCTIAALPLSGWMNTAAAQEKKEVRIYVLPLIELLPLQAAMEKGYFEEEGIKVNTQAGSAGAVGIPGLVGGAYDVVFANVVSVILARSQGLDIKILANGSETRPDAPDIGAIVVRADDNIKSAADLNGKSLAITRRNDILWLYSRDWIKTGGGDDSKVQFREVPVPQMVDALKRKQVDAIFAVEPFVNIARSDPSLKIIGYPYAELQPSASVGQYVVTQEFLDKYPETATRIARAIRKGAEWVTANVGTPAYVEMASRYSKLKPELIGQLAAPVAPQTVNLKSVQKTIKLMKEFGMLETEMDAASVVDKRAL